MKRAVDRWCPRLGVLAGVVLAAGWLASAGCSDDTTSTDARVADQRVADQGPPDGAPDGAADLGLDASADLTAADGAGDGALDAGADAADAMPPDVGPPDGPPADLGTPVMVGTISRTVAPALDAKGKVYIRLYDPIFPVLGVSRTIAGVHLPLTTTKVPYKVHNVAPGKYTLQVFLDDNSNTLAFPFPMPDGPDLVQSTTPQVTITKGKTLKLDLVLDALEGASGDGGGGLTGLKGKVTSKVNPSGDGKGTLWVSLHSKVPPAGQVDMAQLAGADLSSPFASETYFIGSSSGGNYYLRVFLDDNGNANVFFPAPDKGDMTHSSPIQVHLTAGKLNVHDVVLDALAK